MYSYLYLFMNPSARMNLETLVERARQGDTDAWSTLYQAYAGPMKGVCIRLLGRRDEAAEDLVHDAFLLAFADIGKLRNPQRFGQWLTSIVTHLTLQYLERRRRHPSRPLRPPAVYPPATGPALQRAAENMRRKCRHAPGAARHQALRPEHRNLRSPATANRSAAIPPHPVARQPPLPAKVRATAPPYAPLGRTTEIPAQLRLYLVLVSARPHCRERDGRTAPLREKETGREEKIFSRLVKKTSCRLFTKKTHIRNHGRAYRDLRRIC